ncbi:MAG TPA: glycosyltransferase [Thermoanaerobaculia bacterium]|jgi:glycosyltransferase involved in cell wall biosynthesis|nr:glycosyltransferase [Thermoanaerobaculia bacterium]
MKIAIVGAFTQSNFEAFLAAAFRELGHEVVAYDVWSERPAPWFGRRVVSVMSGVPRIRHSYRRRYVAAHSEKVAGYVRKQRPDFVIAHNGVELDAETIRSIVRSLKVPFATYAADDPTLALMQPEYLPALPAFTHVFACESALVPKLRLLTPNRVEFVSCGAPSDVYYPVAPTAEQREKYGCNIGYASSGYSGSPYGVYRALLLQNVADLGLKVFGDRHWDYIAAHVPEIRESIRVTGFLGPQEMNALFASARIFAGIVHPQMVSGVGQRIFDAAAAGAFILAEHKTDIEWAFPNGEVETFRTKEEMRDKAMYYLAHEDERQRKAAAARERVLSHHTWKQKAQQMLDVVFS